MKLTRAAIYCAFLLCCCHGPARAEAADLSPALPAIIVGGFSAWARGGVSQALDTWQKGGLMEGDRKVAAEAAYFKRLGPALGAYKGYDVLQAQSVSQNSQVLYLALNFERAAVYGRFLLYRTDQDWVVQNMDFNVKPEAVVPWMALPTTAGAE